MPRRNYPIPSAGPRAYQDRVTPQRDGIIFESVLRPAATYVSPAYDNYDALGARFFINITDIGTNGTLTVTLQNFDPASQTWIAIPQAVTAALAAAAGTTFTVYPGVAESANVDIGTPLGVKWRLSAVVATTVTGMIFTIGGDYISS